MDRDGLIEHRAKRGDKVAFAELVRASGARLDATARLILRDPHLAQDAVQETLIRAWRDLPGLRDPGAYDHWLHSLVAHACIDIARKRRRRVVEVEAHADVQLLADGTTQVVDRDLMDRALARLEPEARAVLVLHFYLDLPLSRVAESRSALQPGRRSRDSTDRSGSSDSSCRSMRSPRHISSKDERHDRRTPGARHRGRL